MTATPPELVIFDCDGVLVDSETLTCRVISEVAATIDVDVSPEGAMALFEGGHWTAVLEALAERRGGPIPEGFTERFRERLYQVLDEQVEPVPGIPEVLAELSIPFCVASNGPREKMRTTLGRTGLLPHFEGRIFSAWDRERFKPDPDLFLHAAKTLGVDPSRCVVVEDSLNGVQAGLAAGMRTLAYARPRPAEAFEALGAESLQDMRELPVRLGLR